MNLLDILGEIDKSENIQTIRFNNKSTEIDLSKILNDNVKFIILRILDLAEVTFNGLRIPRRSIQEYDNEFWINIQIEKYIIGLIQQRSAK